MEQHHHGVLLSCDVRIWHEQSIGDGVPVIRMGAWDKLGGIPGLGRSVAAGASKRKPVTNNICKLDDELLIFTPDIIGPIEFCALISSALF